MNNLKGAVQRPHRHTTGVHGAADGGNALTSPMPLPGDLDTSIDLVSRMKTRPECPLRHGRYGAHRRIRGRHAEHHDRGVVRQLPAGLFDLANDIYTQYGRTASSDVLATS